MDNKIKKVFDSRYTANVAILKDIQKMVVSHPELRFGQILVNLGIIEYEHDYINDVRTTKDPFYEESVTTLNRMKDKC